MGFTFPQEILRNKGRGRIKEAHCCNVTSSSWGSWLMQDKKNRVFWKSVKYHFQGTSTVSLQKLKKSQPREKTRKHIAGFRIKSCNFSIRGEDMSATAFALSGPTFVFGSAYLTSAESAYRKPIHICALLQALYLFSSASHINTTFFFIVVNASCRAIQKIYERVRPFVNSFHNRLGEESSCGLRCESKTGEKWVCHDISINAVWRESWKGIRRMAWAQHVFEGNLHRQMKNFMTNCIHAPLNTDSTSYFREKSCSGEIPVITRQQKHTTEIIN